MGFFKYSPVDLVLTCVGLLFLLLDIVLDVLTAVTFYQEKAYVCLSLLVLFLLGSSVLVQAFSWLWYGYEDFRRETKVEKCLSVCQLRLLHVFQLGIYFRHAGVVETIMCSSCSKLPEPEDIAVYLSHDLSMLRLIETFSESAPQLVLMLTIILQRGQLDPVTVLKALGSASAIACTVTMYHRALRSFLPNKAKQHVTSSLVYFFWNLLLLSSRLIALALFASVLPCFIFTHFLCSWLVFFFFAWRSQTDFMSSACGEWLYRATVGLIWYFDWFNVVEGRTRNRTLLYHGYILIDMCVLCSVWCWKMSTEPPYFEISPSHSIIIAVSVVLVYMLGLLFKLIYYKCYHPTLTKDELQGNTTEKSQTGLGPTRTTTFLRDETDVELAPIKDDISFPKMPILKLAAYGITPSDAAEGSWPVPKPKTLAREALNIDITDGSWPNVVPAAMMEHEDIDTDATDRSWPSPPAPDIRRCNKRMRKLAMNFYS